MARITNEIADKYYSNNNGNFFSLKDNGDIARVQFMFDSIEEIPVFSVHEITIDDKKKYVDCLRNVGDSVDACPLCASGHKTKVARFVPMYDVEEKEVKIWERGRRFMETLAGLINRFSPLSEHCFEIERNGKKGDKNTTYGVFPAERADIVDIDEIEPPKILGTAVMEMSKAEMNEYLSGGGVSKEEERPVVRRRGREAF